MRIERIALCGAEETLRTAAERLRAELPGWTICDAAAPAENAPDAAEQTLLLRGYAPDTVPDPMPASLRDSFDAVFVTGADAARLTALWAGTPHLRVPAEDGAEALFREVRAYLGDPVPLEIERKFLIAYPDEAVLAARSAAAPVEITQTYLLPRSGAEERVRARGQGKDCVYIRTRKRRLGAGVHEEEEDRLTEAEYRVLLKNADPACRPIRKRRWCVFENGLYYEIDLYLDQREWAILETELTGADQPVRLPDWVTVIREVTGERAFSNHAMAYIKHDGEE